MEKLNKYGGIACIAGGILGVLLAPIMVAIKYLTGWAIIPKPAWIDFASPVLNPLLSFGPPTELWTTYGMLYTVALTLMFAGLLVLWRPIRNERNRTMLLGYCVFMAGLLLVIPGDAVHSITWHQNGITRPTPGSNPIANTGYAAAMMGMNFVIVGSLMLGIAALRKRITPSWLVWGFILILPSAVLLSVTILPTTPSGGLFLFSFLMIALGYSIASGRVVYQRVN